MKSNEQMLLEELIRKVDRLEQKLNITDPYIPERQAQEFAMVGQSALAKRRKKRKGLTINGLSAFEKRGRKWFF